MNFLSKYEKQIGKRFSQNGYIIEKIQDLNTLNKIEKLVVNFLRKEIIIIKKHSNQFILNNAHKLLKKNKLNQIRLKIIDYLILMVKLYVNQMVCI